MVHGGLGSGGYGPGQHHLGPGNSDDLRFHGSELVMLYDYKVRTATDHKVIRSRVNNNNNNNDDFKGIAIKLI